MLIIMELFYFMHLHLFAYSLQVKQILVQFEYLVQNLAENTDRTTPEELVYMAIEASIIDVLKDSAVDAMHHEVPAFHKRFSVQRYLC